MLYITTERGEGMNNFLRGVIYGLSLVVLNGIIRLFAFCEEAEIALGFVLFLFAGIFFLKREKIGEILTCGFSGLFSMFFFQIVLAAFIFPNINVYVGGFFGTMVALAVALLTRDRQFKTGRDYDVEEYEVFDKKLKIKMLIYALLSAVSFAYLVMADNAGISVGVFAILQTVALWFIVPGKKRLFWMIPIGILCFNSFLSANTIWRVPNLIVCIVLYAFMFTPLNIKDVTMRFLAEAAERLFAPVATNLRTPLEWFFGVTEGKKGYVKRGAIALAISLLFVSVLCAVLSSADMVFSHGVDNMLEGLTDIFTAKTIRKAIIGIAAGIYLFGIVYNAYVDYDVERSEKKIKGDLFIISCVMLSTLAVYTVFVVIQFRYLFSGSSLPYGLNVTEYARRGFFELLGLSCVNIVAILVVTKLTEHAEGKKAVFVKAMNTYLCGVTVVLLASSFYRMWLYNETDGLTRLRFLVFGFLAFEFIGLMITFFYIAKPKFNIVMVYGALALSYYLVLNVVPMDAVVAKNQVDRYLNGEREEVSYVLTLSEDAAREVERVYKYSPDKEMERKCKYWLKDRRAEYEESTDGWRSFNLSKYKLRGICEGIK